MYPETPAMGLLSLCMACFCPPPGVWRATGLWQSYQPQTSRPALGSALSLPSSGVCWVAMGLEITAPSSAGWFNLIIPLLLCRVEWSTALWCYIWDLLPGSRHVVALKDKVWIESFLSFLRIFTSLFTEVLGICCIWLFVMSFLINFSTDHFAV